MSTTENIRWMRRNAVEALVTTLTALEGTSPSELAIAETWIDRLRSNNELARSGWYQPPPDGVIVAIAEPPHFDRVNQPTYRLEQAWPRSDSHLTNESLLFAYASPVHAKTGTIGDFSASLYRGNNAAIRDHLSSVWRLTLEIANEVELAMTFSDVNRLASAAATRCTMNNNIMSINDPASTNIGHTIPWSDCTPSSAELAVIANGSDSDLAALVSGKRQFVSNINDNWWRYGVHHRATP